MSKFPILYSFRRCPYAMRARLAIAASGLTVELREVVLRDKPESMIEASPKATVPVLIFPNGQVVDESIDVARWALAKADPLGMRDFDAETLGAIEALIVENDGPFKSALDHYKYPNQHEYKNLDIERKEGANFIRKLDQMLEHRPYLFGKTFSFADASILPFVRQFAHVDRDWFYDQNWENAKRWLIAFIESERFKEIMIKYPQWHEGDKVTKFGGGN